MKAIMMPQYGSPEVLEYRDIETPTPTDDQVLIKIHAASVNPLDWHIMRAEPWFVRLSLGFSKPKHPFLGADLAGIVEAVGKNVTEFKAGDRVFGEVSNSTLGSLAEYICVTPDNVALIPDNVSFEDAASVGVTGFTALQGLRHGGIEAGQKVLVNGASGGVGTMTVQIAKALGAEVTGVCSTRNLDMVQSIGADHVIDYTTTDFADQPVKYDLIYDAIGNRTSRDFARALTPDGVCVVAGFTTMWNMIGSIIIMGGLRSRFSNQSIGTMGTAQGNKEDLLTLQDMLASGKIKPVIDRCYPLSEAPDAIRYLETMRSQGKVVIQVVQGE